MQETRIIHIRIRAAVRLVLVDGTGPAREVQAGSGGWSQNGAVQVLGVGGEVTGVWVKWPHGTETLQPVEGQVAEVVVRYGGRKRRAVCEVLGAIVGEP